MPTYLPRHQLCEQPSLANRLAEIVWKKESTEMEMAAVLKRSFKMWQYFSLSLSIQARIKV